MRDRQDSLEDDRRIVELEAVALGTEPHALLQNADVMVVGKHRDAHAELAAVNLGQHIGAVHVGELPADDGDVEFAFRCQFEEMPAALHAGQELEPPVAFQHFAQGRYHERIAFGDDHAHAPFLDCFVRL